MTRPTRFLLVDVGNTSTKLRLAEPARLVGKTWRLATADISRPDGVISWRHALVDHPFGRLVLSSVVPAATRTILKESPDALVVDAGTSTGVDLRGYPGARTLGADRLANVAGALALHGPGPLIVVDFGTAATFNALDATGRFLGGVIAPGLRTTAGALTTRTAQLPPVRLIGPFPRAIGRGTQAALRAGALLGFRGMIREIVAALRAELGQEARVVATGGDARQVERWGGVDFAVVDPELTLQGLRIIAGKQMTFPGKTRRII